MKEVKTPKKPLAIYYAIVLLVLLILNFVIMPWASERQVKEVDYGTFMSMTEEKNIGRVDIESNQILFTDKENTQVYKTGLMSDPNLTERLYDAGAQFSSEIVEQASPLLSFLASFVLPIVIFVALGQLHEQKADGQGGRRRQLHDVWRHGQIQRQGLRPVHQGHPLCRCGRRGRGQGEPAGDRGLPARPQQVYRRSAPPCPRASCWWALRAPARPCWPRPWPARPTCPSSPSPARSSWRCSWAWALPRSGTCSSRPRRRPPVSCSSTRSTPSARSGTAAATAATTSGSRP